MFIDLSLTRHWLRSKERKTPGLLPLENHSARANGASKECTAFYRYLTPSRVCRNNRFKGFAEKFLAHI